MAPSLLKDFILNLQNLKYPRVPSPLRLLTCRLCAFLQLFMDKEKAEELWLSRLMSLRQERLMGSPVS